MKTDYKEIIYKWKELEPKDNIDINWDIVNSIVGKDKIQWLEKQPLWACQMVLEMIDDECRLIAEFYNHKTIAEYLELW